MSPPVELPPSRAVRLATSRRGFTTLASLLTATAVCAPGTGGAFTSILLMGLAAWGLISLSGMRQTSLGTHDLRPRSGGEWAILVAIAIGVSAGMGASFAAVAASRSELCFVFATIVFGLVFAGMWIIGRGEARAVRTASEDAA